MSARHRVACVGCGSPTPQYVDPVKHGEMSVCLKCGGHAEAVEPAPDPLPTTAPRLPWTLIQADVLDALRAMPDCSFDGLMSDPPYGLSFMGKAWDYDVPHVDVWRECLRVLKPGAPLVAFGGSRTYHRLACGIEDAGFEMRDCLMWLYAKGFPKSQNIGLAIDIRAGATRKIVGINPHARPGDGKGENLASSGVSSHASHVTAPSTALAQAWDGYGTALKPAYEPIVLARKPLDGTMAENIARWGVGGLAIDACRISGEKPLRVLDGKTSGFGDVGGGNVSGLAAGTTDVGRWPANLMFDEDAAALFDEEVGARMGGKAVRRNGGGGQIFSGIGERGYKPKPSLPDLGYMDGKTNPSRFFFCSKVSTREREFGCEGLPLRSAGEVTDREDDSEGLDSPRAGAGRTGGARNHHPTLKPVSLTTWLAKLIKPAVGGVLLVPYAGAGSEMIGALRAGWAEVVGIERDEAYCEIARARLSRWADIPAHVDPLESRPEKACERQIAMFGGAK